MSLATALTALDTQRDNLAANLTTMGVTASNTETLAQLVPKVLNIESGGGTPTDSRVGTLFTGATIPLTFKNNTNIYENEYEYKSERYNITITGLDSVATITGNGSKNVKVAFTASSSTNSITMFNINLTNDTESYNFVGRFFYYGTEVAAGNCLAVASKILPESGTGDFSNFEIIESSTYPLFSSNTVSWAGVFSHQIIGFIFAKKSTPIEDYFLYDCYAFNQPLTLSSGLTSTGNYFLNNCYSFNQPLTLPSGLTTIGQYFLNACSAFNQPLTLPSGLTAIGGYFLCNCYTFDQFNQQQDYPLKQLQAMSGVLGQTMGSQTKQSGGGK